MPSLHQQTRRLMLIVFLCFIPFFVLLLLFPRHGTQVMLASAVLGFGTVSYIVGRRWDQADLGAKRLTAAIAVLGPLAAFYGYYSGGRMHSALHAAEFAGIIAATLIVPAIVGRAAARLQPV